MATSKFTLLKDPTMSSSTTVASTKQGQQVDEIESLYTIWQNEALTGTLLQSQTRFHKWAESVKTKRNGSDNSLVQAQSINEAQVIDTTLQSLKRYLDQVLYQTNPEALGLIADKVSKSVTTLENVHKQPDVAANRGARPKASSHTYIRNLNEKNGKATYADYIASDYTGPIGSGEHRYEENRNTDEAQSFYGNIYGGKGPFD